MNSETRTRAFPSGLSGYPKGAGNAAHAGALKAGFQNLCIALLTIPGGSNQSTVLTSAFTMIFLLPIATQKYGNLKAFLFCSYALWYEN